MTAYEDLASPHDMAADGRAAGARLSVLPLERAARRATGPVPSIHFDEFPREVAKRDITVSAAAQRLANALQLHLD